MRMLPYRNSLYVVNILDESCTLPYGLSGRNNVGGAPCRPLRP